MVETQYVEYWLEEIGQIPEERETTEELLALLPVLDENQELVSTCKRSLCNLETQDFKT